MISTRTQKTNKLNKSHSSTRCSKVKQNTDSEIHIQRLYEGLRTRMYDYNIVLQLLRESYVSNKRNADKAFSLNQIALEIWDSPVKLFLYLNYSQMKHIINFQFVRYQKDAKSCRCMGSIYRNSWTLISILICIF